MLAMLALLVVWGLLISLVLVLLVKCKNVSKSFALHGHVC